MTESEFIRSAEAVLSQIELALERPEVLDLVDLECSRSGNVLEIEFVDNGSKIIINSQAPLREMWIAAKSGGFHYRHDGQKWRNTRDESEFFSALSHMVSEQGGAAVVVQDATV